MTKRSLESRISALEKRVDELEKWIEYLKAASLSRPQEPDRYEKWPRVPKPMWTVQKVK